MGLSKFLIYVLLVIASGTSNENSMMTQSFLNPIAIVAAFQNSSPAEIQYMITLVDTLIVDNNNVAQAAIDAFENANATFVAAHQAFNQAEIEDWLSLGERDTALQIVEKWTTKVSVASVAKNDAEVVMLAAQDDVEAAYNYFSAKQDKLDREKYVFEEFLDRLTSLKEDLADIDTALLEGSEQSLSEKETLEIIRDQLYAVMMLKVDTPVESLWPQLIEKMVVMAIDAVENAGEHLINPLADAIDVHDHATSVYSDAELEHAVLQAELQDHLANKSDKVARAQHASANLDAAAANLDAATANLDAAQEAKDNAIAHAETANSDLTYLKQLLSELLIGDA